MHEGLLRGMMAVYAGALSWPELVSPAILGVVTMDIFVSGIFPVGQTSSTFTKRLLQSFPTRSFITLPAALNKTRLPCKSHWLMTLAQCQL